MQKIVLYITSKALRQIIDHSIKEEDLVTLECNNQIGNTISLEDFMTHKGYLLGDNDVDYLIIDLSALIDSDEKIVSAIGGFLTMHETSRVIIVAPKNEAGDLILSKLFAIGVRNFAVGSDFVILKQRLKKCMSENGMSYKEAIEYKDVIEREKSEKREIREVNKVMIGIVGSEPRVGCTHNSIIIANQLKKMGYAVAVLEMNLSGAFQMIRQEAQVNMVDRMFFTTRNIDYYPDCDEILQKKILKDKVYNFLVLDFGNFKDCAINVYNKCHIKIALGNVQPWEINSLADFWNRYDDEARKSIHFFINFLSAEKDQKELEKAFKTKFGYIGYEPDPFEAKSFPQLMELLSDYLPTDLGNRKKGRLFGFGRKAALF